MSENNGPDVRYPDDYSACDAVGIGSVAFSFRSSKIGKFSFKKQLSFSNIFLKSLLCILSRSFLPGVYVFLVH